ncbi:Uncharacterised protein [Acinetobacter baumannii]|nr:Uncharacterised protein [Acinetobacter baumannii]
MNDFNEICLIGYNLINIFIGTWNFIDYTTVFTAFNPLCLFNQVLLIKKNFCFASAHFAASSMRTGTKRFRVCFTFNNIRACSHRTWNNS